MPTEHTVDELTPDRIRELSERFDRDVAYAEKAQNHVWVAIAAHHLSETTAKAMATGQAADGVMLDHENLRSLTVGCYVCEQGLDRKLIGRRCPGEPK